MSDIQYMDVCFYDNDFGWSMTNALRRFWGWMNESNGHLTETRSLSEMFLALHEAGALEGLIKRTFVIEQLHSGVEFATRGLYWKEVDWKKRNELEDLTSAIKRYDEYLTIKIKFYKTDEFKKKWENGEHCWLDLTTGGVSLH